MSRDEVARKWNEGEDNYRATVLGQARLSSQSIRRFWVSWEEPCGVGKARDSRPLNTPVDSRVVAWWESGFAFDDSYSTMVAVVDADDDGCARAAIEASWGWRGEWRFIHKKPAEWMPPADRFPRRSR